MTFASQHLEYWKDRARLNPHEALHILNRFDVKAFPPHSTSNNASEVILSSLVGALNNRPKPPHVLVVMLGDTKFWCDDQALNFTMDTIITVLLQELKRIVATRTSDLPLKAQSDEPKFFFVKLNWKPDNAMDSVPEYPKKRRTFNKLLDSVVRPRGAHTILLHEINERFDENLFLGHGDLSEKGYRQLWASLSEAIRDFSTIGHQQKKVYAALTRQTYNTSEVDSPRYSSDGENTITNRICDDKWKSSPNIQNKRRRQKYHKGQFDHYAGWKYTHEKRGQYYF